MNNCRFISELNFSFIIRLMNIIKCKKKNIHFYKFQEKEFEGNGRRLHDPTHSVLCG